MHTHAHASAPSWAEINLAPLVGAHTHTPTPRPALESSIGREYREITIIELSALRETWSECGAAGGNRTSVRAKLVQQQHSHNERAQKKETRYTGNGVSGSHTDRCQCRRSGNCTQLHDEWSAELKTRSRQRGMLDTITNMCGT